MRIFISHPSDVLTDFMPHGDGLVAAGTIRELARRGHSIAVAAATVAVREPFPSNVAVYCTGITRTVGLWRVPFALRVRALFKHLHAEEPFDVIHQLNPVVCGLSFLLPAATPIVLGPLVANWSDAPLMRSPISRAAHALTEQTKKRVAVIQARRATALIVSTPAALAHLPRDPATLDKVRLIPHGVDTSKFAPQERNAREDDRPPTILFFANLHERKGIWTLLAAFERLDKAQRPATLLIAGDGDASLELDHRIADSPVASRIARLGAIEREDIPGLMARASVYCLPSYGEPFGMSAVEAMACGVPVVVTDAGGLSEIVPDGVGVKVPPRDPVALAKALSALLGDPAQRRERGDAGRQHVLRHFSLHRVADGIEKVYLDVTGAAKERLLARALLTETTSP